MSPGQLNKPVFLALRWLVKQLCRPYFLLARRLVVEGRYFLPRRCRSMVLVCNHASLLDTYVLMCVIRPHFTVCGAKPKYFATPLRRFAAAVINVMKVDDQQQFLRDCTALLNRGEMLLIYPEMGRYPQGMAKFKTWAAEVVLHNNVSVVPCHITGTGRDPSRRIRLRVGPSFTPRGDRIQVTRELRHRIAVLADPPTHAPGRRDGRVRPANGPDGN